MMTNVFHIIPQSLIKKMGIDEKRPLHYLNVIENSEKTPISFDVKNLKPGSREQSLFELANIIEEAWNNSQTESDFSSFAQNLRKDLKADNKKFKNISIGESGLIDILWERSDFFSDNHSSKGIFNPNDILTLIIKSLNSILALIPDSWPYIIAQSRERVKDSTLIKMLYNLRKEMVSFNRNVRPKEKNPYFDYQNDSTNLYATIIYRKQPLFSNPYIKLNPELVDMEYKKLAPYGYSLIQLNKNSSLLIFDFLEKLTGHKKIIEAFEGMNNETFKLVMDYFYDNAIHKCVRNIISNEEGFLKEFKNSLSPKLNTSIFKDVNQVNDMLGDFNVSSTHRLEKYYLPVEKLFQKAFRVYPGNEELSLIYMMGFILRGPENWTNKNKSIQLEEELKLLLEGRTSVNEFISKNWVFVEETRYYFEEILETSLDRLIKEM